jgi:hypothetical protein
MTDVAPERLWLHGIGSHHGEVTWCDDPNPSGEPEELEEAVEYVRADQWQPIETAPKDGTVVLLWACDEDEWEDAHDEPRDPQRYWYPARVSVQKHIWWIAGGMMRQLKGATHWMPLPAAPSLHRANPGAMGVGQL